MTAQIPVDPPASYPPPAGLPYTAPPVPTKNSDVGGKITVAGGALILVGTFMPWIIMTNAYETASQNGFAAPDGGWMLLFGVLIGAVGFSRMNSQVHWGTQVLPLFVAAFAGWAAIADISSVATRAAPIAASYYASWQMGPGLYVIVLGAAVTIVGALTFPAKD